VSDHGAESPLPPVGWPEALVAVAAFLAMCAAVLTRTPKLLEGDDYAYQASIIALSHGQLVLGNADYQALLNQMLPGGLRLNPFVHLAGGGWISEKNPGYPFLAVAFQALGVLRIAPLFYGALGCLGLFVGGRRWLGRWGGTWAVVLFCSSGAALVFAWRATMPSFTDACLVAAGYGALVWAMLAAERSPRARTVVGLLGFVALEAATFSRYTNMVLLAVAVLGVLLTFRRAGLPGRSAGWWLGSVGLFAGGVLAFDQAVYGAPLRTGYASGEITFSLGAVAPNLEHMPAHLVASMPMLVLGLVAIGWLAVWAARSRRPGTDPSRRASDQRDALVGALLAAGWIGIWGLYAAYDWTVQTALGANSTVQVVRFYLPAIGLVALLGAWLLAQLPRWMPAAVLVVLVGLGAWSYPALAAGNVGGPGGRGGPQAGGPPHASPPGGSVPAPPPAPPGRQP
jgi:hypothetical protein